MSVSGCLGTARVGEPHLRLPSSHTRTFLATTVESRRTPCQHHQLRSQREVIMADKNFSDRKGEEIKEMEGYQDKDRYE